MQPDSVTLSLTERHILTTILERSRIYRPRSVRDMWPQSWDAIVADLRKKIAPPVKDMDGPVLLEHVAKHSAYMGRSQRVILRHLMENAGATAAELADQIAAWDDTGGPLNARKCIDVSLYRLRARLRPEWKIISTPNMQFRLVKARASTARSS